MLQQPIITQKPIFAQNPLRLMANNKYSGTLHISNLNHMNKLYDIMKEALMQDNNINMGDHGLINPYHPSIASTSYYNHSTPNLSGQTNAKPNKLFITVKGQKIFNIIKEVNQTNRRKSVQIVYNNDEYSGNNANPNYDYEYEEQAQLNKDDEYIQNEKEEGYYDHAREEDNENENEEVIEEEQNHQEGHDYIYGNYPSWTNIFK